MSQIINHIQILKVPVQAYRRLVVSLTRARACHLSLQQSNILYSFRYLWHSSRRGIFLLSPDSQRGHANPSLIILLWHKHGLVCTRQVVFICFFAFKVFMIGQFHIWDIALYKELIAACMS